MIEKNVVEKKISATELQPKFNFHWIVNDFFSVVMKLKAKISIEW